MTRRTWFRRGDIVITTTGSPRAARVDHIDAGWLHVRFRAGGQLHKLRRQDCRLAEPGEITGHVAALLPPPES